MYNDNNQNWTPDNGADSQNNNNNGQENQTPNFIMRDPQPDQQTGETQSQAVFGQGQQTQPQAAYSQTVYGQGQQTQSQTEQTTYSQPQTGQNQQSYQDAGASYRQQAYQSERPRYDYIPEEPHHRSRKKSSLAGRAAGITAAALLFGVVSGGVMTGVNYVSNYLIDSSYETSAEQSESVTTQTASSETSGSSSAASAVPAISMDVSSIVEKAMPSIVAINSTTTYQSYGFFGPQTYSGASSGSGIIVGMNDDELLIVTNNHVVSDSSDLKVIFIDETSSSASIKGTDTTNDLAVIAVPLSDISDETKSQISVATLGDSDSLKVGEGVIAIGNALGYGQSVTVGYISAKDREVQTDQNTVASNLLQTDAAINPGNSGGALLNMKGEVVGINSAKYSSTEVEGMGYAIPISKVQDIIDDLMNVQTRTQAVAEEDQGYLGIQGQNIDLQASSTYDMPQGIYVYKITEGSAAADSDLREKDIITKFDGQGVKTMADLKELLTYYEKGTTVTLTVQSLENGTYVEREVEVTLGQKPADQLQQQ